MNEAHVITLLSLLRSVYEAAGVNYEQMIEILRLKLIMDRRRVNLILSQEKEGSREENLFQKSMIPVVLIGIVVGMVMLMPISLFLRMQMFVLMFLVILTSIFISDYSSVLLDGNQKGFFMSGPIDERTFSAAKLTHIVLYILLYALSLSAAGILVGTIQNGIVFLGMSILTITLTVILSVCFASLGYVILLSFFTGERLRDIINYFQIGVTVLLMVVYQVVPRMIGMSNLLRKEMTYPNWMYLLPSGFLSAPYQLLFEGEASSVVIVSTIASIFVPVGLLLLYLVWFTPYLERNLHRLSIASKRVKGLSLLERLSVMLLGSNAEEKTFMNLYFLLFKRERRTKLRVLPQVTLALVYPFLFLFNSSGGYNTIAEEMKQSPYFLVVYTILLTTSALYSMFETSENTRMAQSHLLLPITNRVNLYTSAMKCIYFKYVLPLTTVHCILFGYLSGASSYIDLGIVFANILIVFFITSSMGDIQLPLSQEEELGKGIRLQSFFRSLPVGLLFFGIHLPIVLYAGWRLKVVWMCLSLLLAVLMNYLLLGRLVERTLKRAK